MEIYGTIGPACADMEMLCQMIEAGMTGIRLNLSHTSMEASKVQRDMIRTAAEAAGRPCRLLIDLQGPELRIGVMNQPLSLKAGETVMLGGQGIPVPKLVMDAVCPGDQLLLDDGKLLLRVRDEDTADILRGGQLESRKSIAIVGKQVDTPALTPQDRINIAMAVSGGVSAVMQPFVRSRADLEEVRRTLDEAGGQHIRLLAKIENLAGMENLEDFFGTADEIVIARGDLGNAMPLWELPAAQKKIARACRTAGVPFMVVTQMLASMEQRPVPTRAEVSDIFNAVLDGASSVMVTAETAVGRYPAESIRYLTNTVAAAQTYLMQKETDT
ncbi:MAG: pyruvate kinase [Clostridia bacterium]|nr:pyruvate kinase [Clostridia bacterium]